MLRGTLGCQSASGSYWTICRRTSPAPLYQAFRLAKRDGCCAGWSSTTSPSTPSWLNMVEIEIGVLRSECLDRRIATKEQLVSEIAAWERQRNASGARINGCSTTEKARAKMGRAYPEPIGATKELIIIVQRY